MNIIEDLEALKERKELAEHLSKTKQVMVKSYSGEVMVSELFTCLIRG